MSAKYLLSLLLLGAATACFPTGAPAGAFVPGPTAAYYGMPKQGPSHPPTAESAWPSLEASAARAAQSEGATLAMATRLTSGAMKAPSPCVVLLPGQNRVICVAQAFPVKANECYTVGVAWGWPSMVRVDVLFEDRSKSFEGDQGTAAGKFCADHAGTVSINVSSLTSQRMSLTSELLEYALAVASRPEDASAAMQRRKAEASEVSAQRSIQAQRVQRASADCDQCGREENNCRASGRRSLDCYMERRRCDDRKRNDGC